MQWMLKLRLRVFALLVALALLVFGVVSVFSVGVFPAVGAAIAIAVTMVNSMTSRLSTMTCAGCGQSIDQLPAGTHGIACKDCGAINHPYNTGEAVYVMGVDPNDFDYSDDEDLS